MTPITLDSIKSEQARLADPRLARQHAASSRALYQSQPNQNLPEKRMTRTAVLVGLPLSMTFVPGLQKAIAGILATLNSPAVTQENIERGR